MEAPATFSAPTPRKSYVVTGADGGLGRVICDVLRAGGADVVGVDLNGPDVLHADISTTAGVTRMVDAALENHGRLDGLILNATTQHRDELKVFPEDAWDRVVGVNLRGPFLAIKHGWPYLTDEPGKRVVVTCSTSAWVAEPRKVAYVASKTGVLGLVRAAACEASRFELTVNGVAPGLMDTPLVSWQLDQRAAEQGVDRELIEAQWLSRPGRYVETREVADTIAFLLSDAASGINGQVIPVDLGALASE